jgi:peptidoglycan/LPS O-acetylase OafA/YrhL
MPPIAYRLDRLAHGRANNLNLLRMIAATMVVLSHSYALLGRAGDEPLVAMSRASIDAGTIGVITFFGISGFLIAQSLERTPSLVRYATARALRILPGLYLAKLFCVVAVGWTVTMLPSAAYWTDAGTWSFLFGTPFLGLRDRLPGVFATLPYPLAVNGSLWTIPVEIWCYAAAAMIAVAGFARRARLYTALFVVAIVAYVASPHTTSALMPSGGYGTVPGLLASFFFGGWLHVCRRRIPVSLPAAGIVALIIVACSRLPWIAAPCYFFGIPYLALVAAYHPRLLWRRYLEFGDYSYGTYVLAFPIQQLLIWQLGPLQSPMLFALTLAVTLPLAMVSWHMVEAPALALKSTLGAYRLRFSTGSRHARSRDS